MNLYDDYDGQPPWGFGSIYVLVSETPPQPRPAIIVIEPLKPVPPPPSLPARKIGFY